MWVRDGNNVLPSHVPNNTRATTICNLSPLPNGHIYMMFLYTIQRHTTSPTLICGDKQHTCMQQSTSHLYIDDDMVYDIIGIVRDTIHNISKTQEHNNILDKYTIEKHDKHRLMISHL